VNTSRPGSWKTTKTVPAVFHLDNKETKPELKVNDNNKTALPLTPAALTLPSTTLCEL